VTFLHAAATDAGIRSALEAGGYAPKDHEEGLALLLAVCAIRAGGLDPADDEPARRAAAELAGWTRTHLPRLRAALERLHPEALALFAGLDERQDEIDGRAVLVMATLLERLRALEAKGGACEVMETLARRGVDGAERRRLGDLVVAAQRAEAPSVGAVRLRSGCGDAMRAGAEIVALHRWLYDWSTTARAFVGRKDWLMRLGVMRRRRREGREAGA
jgi:hypothetical protein